MTRKAGTENLARRSIRKNSDVNDVGGNKDDMCENADEMCENADEMCENADEMCENAYGIGPTKGIYPDISLLEESEINDDGGPINPINKTEYIAFKHFFFGIPKFIHLVFIGIVIISFWVLYIRHSIPEDLEPTKIIHIETIMIDLEKQFKDQPIETFKVIRAALNKFNNSMSPQPVVIVLLVAKNANAEGYNFGCKLADKILKGYLEIDGKKMKSLDPDKAKQIIDYELRSNFSESSYINVLLVNNFQAVPSEAVMIFHTYCDHENSSFKNAIYIMVVYSDLDISRKSESKEWERLLGKTLERSWNGLHLDDRLPLMSRISGRVVAILPKL